MNKYTQTTENGLETFVSNLNNLYIELIIDQAVKKQQKSVLKQKIDESLVNGDKDAFMSNTNALKALEEI